MTIKRVYEPVSDSDGFRILIDRLWPRGLAKNKANIDIWLKEIAPSTELRQWYHHEVSKWPEFKHRYHQELMEKPDVVATLRSYLQKGAVTVLYSAKDETHNNAVALKEYLEQG